MTIQLYGIPNCDTVRKARKWLEAEGREYAFHDYKKEGVDAAKLVFWADALGWEAMINKRGTTFRKLDDADKEGIDREKAIALMVEHPSMIKRPVAEHAGGVLVGFKADEWETAL